MTEAEAKQWIDSKFGAAALSALERFVRLLENESTSQNLVSRSSMETIWSRHIVDSAQLIDLAHPDGIWLDIGTGAGFPGLVTAIVAKRQTVLAEPRRRRVAFLQGVIDDLGIASYVDVQLSRVETLKIQADVISARAVATIDALLTATSHCSNKRTQFVLPKGRRAIEEVAQAKKSWHGTFHVEHSITDPESMIVVASGISRR